MRAFACSNTSHYSITVIKLEGYTDSSTSLCILPVSDPFPPPVAITTDQIGPAIQTSCWISPAKMSCKTEKGVQGLWKWASGAEKTTRLPKASLEVRN